MKVLGLLQSLRTGAVIGAKVSAAFGRNQSALWKHRHNGSRRLLLAFCMEQSNSPFLHPRSPSSSGSRLRLGLRTSEGQPQILPSSSGTRPLSALTSPAHYCPVSVAMHRGLHHHGAHAQCQCQDYVRDHLHVQMSKPKALA